MFILILLRAKIELFDDENLDKSNSLLISVSYTSGCCA